MDYTEYEPVNTAYEVKYTHYLYLLHSLKNMCVKNKERKVKIGKYSQAGKIIKGY